MGTTTTVTTTTVSLLTPSEMADRLGVGRQTVLDWMHAGVIPGIQVNRRTVRFRPDAVLAALEKKRRTK